MMVLPCINMNWPQVYMCPLPPQPPPHPITPGCHRALPECPVSDFHWLLFYIGNIICLNAIFSNHPTLSSESKKSVFYVCVYFGFLHIGTIFLDSIVQLSPYTCTNIWYLSFILPSVGQVLGSSTSLELTQMHSFL